jgi:hypothetical protein
MTQNYLASAVEMVHLGCIASLEGAVYSQTQTSAAPRPYFDRFSPNDERALIFRLDNFGQSAFKYRRPLPSKKIE